MLSRPVYKLQVSKVAVALCLSVLVFLGFTTLLIAIGYRHYFKALPRDINTLASVIALVYDSPRLLRWVAEHGVLGEGGKGEGREEVKAVLGDFQGSEGEMRWGIELVDGDDGGETFGKKHTNSRSISGYELLAVRDLG